MWMHNGGIAGWKHVKRALATDIGARWFLGVNGNTDSEWAFALFLDCLEKAGYDPDDKVVVEKGFGHKVLRQAMLRTIERINDFVAAHVPVTGSGKPEDGEKSLLNFAVTDGHSVVCTRYVSSRMDEAASLYFSSGTDWRFMGEAGMYKMERRDRGADIVLVASEPLTFERGECLLAFCKDPRVVNEFLAADNWVTVPTNSVITIHKQTVMIHPIEDQYYCPAPSYQRSTGYAVSKGLVSTAPGITEGNEPPAAQAEALKAKLGEVVEGTKGMRLVNP